MSDQGLCRNGQPHYCPNYDNTFRAAPPAGSSSLLGRGTPEEQDDQSRGGTQAMSQRLDLPQPATGDSSALVTACRGLLRFIRERYPDDFKPGGAGFLCPHHKAIAAALGEDIETT